MDEIDKRLIQYNHIELKNFTASKVYSNLLDVALALYYWDPTIPAYTKEHVGSSRSLPGARKDLAPAMPVIRYSSPCNEAGYISFGEGRVFHFRDGKYWNQQGQMVTGSEYFYASVGRLAGMGLREGLFTLEKDIRGHRYILKESQVSLMDGAEGMNGVHCWEEISDHRLGTALRNVKFGITIPRQLQTAALTGIVLTKHLNEELQNNNFRGSHRDFTMRADSAFTDKGMVALLENKYKFYQSKAGFVDTERGSAPVLTTGIKEAKGRFKILDGVSSVLRVKLRGQYAGVEAVVQCVIAV